MSEEGGVREMQRVRKMNVLEKDQNKKLNLSSTNFFNFPGNLFLLL